MSTLDPVLRHQNIGLHNVAEVEPMGDGVLLRRFPRGVRQALSPLGRMVAQESSGIELRFVTESKNFRVSLGALPSVLAPHESHRLEAVIFRGAFLHSQHFLVAGQINHLNVVNITGEEKFGEVKAEYSRACGFSSDVWRVFLGRYPAIFYGLETYDTEVRPPRTDEVPSRRWLAYGSSITSGAGATCHHNAFVYHAARAAHLDVCNLGLSGSCLCEPEIAEYLAARECEVLSLEVGVNMRANFSPEQFRERLHFLLDKVCSAQPERCVFLISIFPNSASSNIAADATNLKAQRESAFNEILREAASSARYGNLALIDGSRVLDGFDGLTTDLIHPNDYGHARMGLRLGEMLREHSVG